MIKTFVVTLVLVIGATSAATAKSGGTLRGGDTGGSPGGNSGGGKPQIDISKHRIDINNRLTPSQAVKDALRRAIYCKSPHHGPAC
jgi:hypothetical protein